MKRSEDWTLRSPTGDRGWTSNRRKPMDNVKKAEEVLRDAKRQVDLAASRLDEAQREPSALPRRSVASDRARRRGEVDVGHTDRRAERALRPSDGPVIHRVRTSPMV